MPVTLAQAALNVQDDIDFNVINEFRASSALLDGLPFHQAVDPSGQGSTLTYGYTRQLALRSADFRAINAEYTPAEATKQRYSVDLVPLGGSFQIDRVLAGTARGAEVTFQMRNLIQASVAKFTDAVINGDTAVDADGFDGLDKALTGSTTEMNADTEVDWSDIDAYGYQNALDLIDELIGYLDGQPGAIIANSKAAAKLRSIARRAGQYVVSPVEGLRDAASGRAVTRQFWQEGTVLIDAGDKPGTADPIVPIESRDPDGDATTTTGLTDIYAVRFGMDGFHGVATTGQLVSTWMPDFTTAGAVKTGEAELGPVAVALKATKAAAVLRNVKVQ